MPSATSRVSGRVAGPVTGLVTGLLACLAFVAACGGPRTIHTALEGAAPTAQTTRVVRAPLGLPEWAFARYERVQAGTAPAHAANAIEASFAEREVFELRRDGSYTWTAIDAHGTPTRDELGWARFEGGWLILDPEHDSIMRTVGASSRAAVVAYGTQRCFLPEVQLAAFCNLVNAGRRLPKTAMLAPELAEPVDAPVQATLPLQFAARIVPEPVEMKVIETVTERHGVPLNNGIEFVVDAGWARGLRPGMQVHLLNVPASEKSWPGRLIEVHQKWARGRMRSTDFLPKVGAKLSTREPKSNGAARAAKSPR
ncbi:MAG: hypothetical protein L6Q99_09880 [Planctomycetes bacterium]|nr:hypothetical protein [Planctomycetota bacterium]